MCAWTDIAETYTGNSDTAKIDKTGIGIYRIEIMNSCKAIWVLVEAKLKGKSG